MLRRTPLLKALRKGPIQLVSVKCIGTNAPRNFQNAAVNITASPDASVTTKNLFDNKLKYLESLKMQELISYGAIGLCTLNKFILDIVIKLFPYTPMPLVRMFVYKLYCGGETIPEVIKSGERLSERGIKNMMLSLSIEACDGNEDIDINYIVSETAKSINEILYPHTLKMVEATPSAINEIPPAYVALKPTGLVDDAAEVLRNFDKPEYKAQFETLVENCNTLCTIVQKRNEELLAQYPERVAPFAVITVDAEAHPLQQGVYELQRRLYKKFNPANKPISVIGTIQMYLKESAPLLKYEEELAKKEGYRLGLKLVRGAYIHSEANRDVIHDTKLDTDKNYDNAIAYSIENIVSGDKNNSTIGHLVVASHNSDSQYLATKLLRASENPATANVVLGQLLGMADDVTFDLIENHQVNNIIKYVPWGPPKETKAYLHRRLEENGDAVRSDNGWPLVKGVSKALWHKMTRSA